MPPAGHDIDSKKKGKTMPAYVIALYNVWDQSWRPKYREPVIELIKKHGGRYVVRADVCPWEMLEGRKPDINGITVIAGCGVEAVSCRSR